MNLDDFDLSDEDERKLEQKRDELIENQPEHVPNDGCEGGACII
jgi:hypothetical protein